jgi:hypothetical protein
LTGPSASLPIAFLVSDSRSDIIDALRRLGLIASDETPLAEPLTGGVSSDIWKVALRGRTLCVKRALREAQGRAGLAGARRAQCLRGRLDAGRR